MGQRWGRRRRDRWAQRRLARRRVGRLEGRPHLHRRRRLRRRRVLQRRRALRRWRVRRRGRGPCVSHVGCVIDGCIESDQEVLRTLTRRRTIDFDKDGYVSAECGGPDCDDKDPNVFPGAPELCDGRD
ncbi:MAG: putative metal-binding motif-containing protein [Myxococcales bacterium]|nr:putative metal-binding motif-containing protein [Myxococcales bacterium]